MGAAKDIGSIFPIIEGGLNAPKVSMTKRQGFLTFSLCREALFAIMKNYSTTSRKVLLPAYTCQTVINPFIQAGWSCEFFGIDSKLRIKANFLLELANNFKPDIIVVHPYFGMDLNAREIGVLEQLKAAGTVIVGDFTQCLFSECRSSVFDYYVGSLRKWFPIPDGAFLYAAQGSIIPNEASRQYNEFVSLQYAAMLLRGKYFLTGDINLKETSRYLIGEADSLACGKIIPHRMSNISIQIITKEDMALCKRKRLENYSFLFNGLVDKQDCVSVCRDLQELTCPPLYFPLYVRGRARLQKWLATNQVYTPILWPIEFPAVVLDDTVKDIYDTILAIPCDQRYGIDDMQLILDLLEKYETAEMGTK